MDVKLEASWKEKLKDQFELPYFQELTKFVKESYASETIYPNPKNIFRALELTPFDKVEVVIIGQDPYHGPKQANGLAFSVQDGVRVPPSLQNIFKEIRSDTGKPSIAEGDGDLTKWAEQGVLLLNATLTVKAHAPGSHQGKGWEQFTDAVIAALNKDRKQLVYILWGSYARKKAAVVDRDQNLVLESPHPSPFSADKGFFGSRPFSQTNIYLEEMGKKPIEW
jgi:uracil-DNA glycosylase